MDPVWTKWWRWSQSRAATWGRFHLITIREGRRVGGNTLQVGITNQTSLEIKSKKSRNSPLIPLRTQLRGARGELIWTGPFHYPFGNKIKRPLVRGGIITAEPALPGKLKKTSGPDLTKHRAQLLSLLLSVSVKCRRHSSSEHQTHLK